MPWFALVPAFVWKAIASLVLVGGVYLWIENKGEQKALAKVEASNVKAVETANRGGSGTRDRSRRGVRDPFTVD